MKLYEEETQKISILFSILGLDEDPAIPHD
jgi:hypothetical protein